MVFLVLLSTPNVKGIPLDHGVEVNWQSRLNNWVPLTRNIELGGVRGTTKKNGGKSVGKVVQILGDEED